MRSYEFVTEKKRNKRRPRLAAYGPGPFGGYGYLTGYSGDAGGGVGEDQNLKELNIADTLKFIKQAHGDQLYGRIPYWRHPRAVALTGRKIFGSKFDSEAVKVAFLHDVVEDTYVGLDELMKLGFSRDVVEAVNLLTKDKTLSYTDNIKRIISSGNKLAQMVKYADNYENFTSDKSDWNPDRVSASQRKYLASLNMLGDHLGVQYHVQEGWRDTIAGLALGAGVAMGNPADAKTNVERVVVSPGQTVYSIAKAFDTTPSIIQKLNKLDKNFTIKPGQEIKVPKLDWADVPPEEEKKPQAKKSDKKEIKISKADLENSITGRPLEVYFRKFLESQGIKGQELAAIMAQSDVETDHFKTLKEYGSKNYFKMYEPVFRKDKKTGKLIMDPETKRPKHFNEKADDLGNDYRGDGARYKGRGFLQVTGRYNYRVIGRDIGVDLEKNPEILETNKEIAAKASLAYWKRFSKPKIKNFKDVKGVTSTINPGLKHLEKRKERHKEYKVAMQ